jgi:hypothetical protein
MRAFPVAVVFQIENDDNVVVKGLAQTAPLV